MSSSITLSAGVRQNLLSLQDTASLIASTQNRLATGKKVTSALDNPGSFFTSQSLSNRASDLNNLLDSIGQATSTLAAANQGITSLTTLVNSAKSIATQAQQSTPPTATYANNITGNATIAADTSRSVSANTFASLSGLVSSAHSTYTIDTAAIATAATVDGDNFTLTDGSKTIRFERDVTGNGVTAGSVSFATKADLKSALQSFFGASNYAVSGDTVTISGSDYSTNFTAASGTAGLVAGVTNANSSDTANLTISQGATTATFRYVSSGASAGAGTFTTLSDLNAAINASTIGNSGGPALSNKVLASDDGTGHLKLETDGSTAFTVGGTLSGSTKLNNAGTSNDNYNATLAGLTGTLSIKVGTASAQTIAFGTGNVETRAALTTALAGITGVSASITANHVALTSTTSDDITISGTNNAASGLFAGANVGVNSATVSAGTTSTTRSSLQSQYNALLTQIDQLSSDSSYNGINLIHGDNLKVTFNEQGTSSLTITGVTLDHTGLGLATLSGSEFQNNASIDTVVGNLNSALTQLRSQAASFGTNLTTVQTRQDFTKNLINTLQTGSDNLVLADTNLEGANLLALQTRQSLSTTALSLANQANQAVLRLFG